MEHAPGQRKRKVKRFYLNLAFLCFLVLGVVVVVRLILQVYGFSIIAHAVLQFFRDILGLPQAVKVAH